MDSSHALGREGRGREAGEETPFVTKQQGEKWQKDKFQPRDVGSRFKVQPPNPNLFIPLIIMSGLNRLFVPDLGDQANLMLLYQSRQADTSAQRDG